MTLDEPPRGDTRNAARRAAGWGFVGSMMPAFVDLASSDWFGASDLPALVLCSLPFVVILALSGRALGRRVAHHRIWTALVIGAIAGIAVGFLWTLSVLLLMGGWFGAFSFPSCCAG